MEQPTFRCFYGMSLRSFYTTKTAPLPLPTDTGVSWIYLMDLIAKYKQEYRAVLHGEVAAKVVDSLLKQYCVDNELYREWLVSTGGGPIGSDWYDGIHELADSQESLRINDWSITGFVIGWDGAGNPLVLKENGMILTEDHNFGGIHEVAQSFEALLAEHVSS